MTTSAALTVAPNSTTAWPRSVLRRSSSMVGIAVMWAKLWSAPPRRLRGTPWVISYRIGRLSVRDLHHQGGVRRAAADPARPPGLRAARFAEGDGRGRGPAARVLRAHRRA